MGLTNRVDSLYGVFGMFLAVCLMGCTTSEEIERIKSPDGRVELVVTQSSGGATTSTLYKVFLVPTGQPPKENEEKFIADHIQGMSIEWSKAGLVSIGYREARIYKFSNFWVSKDLDEAHYVVELKLSPLSDLFSLSAEDRETNGVGLD